MNISWSVTRLSSKLVYEQCPLVLSSAQHYAVPLDHDIAIKTSRIITIIIVPRISLLIYPHLITLILFRVHIQVNYMFPSLSTKRQCRLFDGDVADVVCSVSVDRI